MRAAAPLPSGLLHPVSLAALAVLLLNDHVLKTIHPGALAGKLSDLAGMVFFPLLLIEVVSWFVTRPREGTILLVLATVGAVFVSIQLWAPAADAYRHGLGYLQYPFRYLGGGAGSPAPVAHTPDGSDLLALPALMVAWWVHRAQQAPHPDEAHRVGLDVGDHP